MKKVTAADVARACGVSQATVSYVLNNRADKQITEKTREKVLEAARALDYYPDVCAQSMRMRRAMSIGVVVGQDSINLSFSQVLRGIKNVLYRNGYSITLLPDDEPSDRAQFISYYLSRRVDGILFLYMNLDAEAQELLTARGIPFLTINEAGIQGCGVSVCTGLKSVVRECVLYCRDNAFTRACYLNFARAAVNPNVTRKFTLLKNLFAEEYPQAVLTEHELERGLEDEALNGEIARIFKAERPQVVFAPLPRLSLVTQGCILRERLCVPQEIKLISLYDSRFFDGLYPSVSHIEFPLGDMGGYACECLMDTLAGRAVTQRAFRCSMRWGMSTQTEVNGQ